MPGTAAMLVARHEARVHALGGLARERFCGTRASRSPAAPVRRRRKPFSRSCCARAVRRARRGAPANENNEIGVSKLLLARSNDAHDVVVVEMGARHYGDIAPLVEIARPDVGILTNVGDAHLEIMGSRERLAETKWALFAARRARRSSTPPTRSRWRRAPTLAPAPHWFAARAATTARRTVRELERLTAFVGEHRLIDRARRPQRRRTTIDLRVPGMHNRANLAAAVGRRARARRAARRSRRRDSESRAARRALRPDRARAAACVLIYDAYNANAERDDRRARRLCARSRLRAGSPCSRAWRSWARSRRDARARRRARGAPSRRAARQRRVRGGARARRAARRARRREIVTVDDERAGRALAARARARATTSCCSRARASTSSSRSSRSCAREPRACGHLARRRRPKRLRVSRFRCARRSCGPATIWCESSPQAVAGIARPGDVVAVSETARCDRARRVRRRRTRSSVAAGVRALRAAPDAMATISQPESMQLVIDRAGTWHGDLRDAAAASLGRLAGTARRLLRDAGRGGRGVRRVHRNDAAVRARDRVRAARSGRVSRESMFAADRHRLRRRRRQRSRKGRRSSGARPALCDERVEARCSTIRTATATSRRRSSCSSGAEARRNPLVCSEALHESTRSLRCSSACSSALRLRPHRCRCC